MISDLHLGEDLGVEASEQTRRDVAMGANAACDFLAHLTHRRVDGRPWRLVVNGDFLDFQAAFVPLSHPGLAGVAELGGTGVTDRLISGAGRVPVASAIRVDRIAEAHPRVFTALARFLRAGNRIDFVAGNHDREITHPTVAARMRAALVRGGALAAETTARVDFHEWFVLEPGVAWIEHGHQYDAQCSFEHGLSPYDGHGEVIPNVDAASVRHLGSVAGVDAHSTEEWSFGGYVQHAASLGPRGFVRLVGGYARFMMGLWRASRIQRGLRQRGRRAADHERRLAELATERGLSVGELRDLDGLRRMPVTRNMTRVCRMLMLDRLALLALALVGAVLVAAIGGWPWGFVGGVGTLLGGVVGGEAMAGRPPRDPSVALAMIPERIRRVTHVPVVVFGHTHIPQEVALPGGGTYVNGGTWLPAIHPGLLRAFTHVVILRGPDGPTVRLRQWRDGHSRPYVPDVDHG
ncbi:MAG: hypothetical protein KC464_27305, partial [Myxococcales bacterium]|nr:hypothetical protein [Myxococcales bacterium]